MTSKFSLTCSEVFCPIRGETIPGVERINCNAPKDAFLFKNSGTTPGCNNLPCMNGTLEKTPIPKFWQAVKIEIFSPFVF